MNPIFLAIVSFLFSMSLGYPALAIAKKLNLIDIPGSASHKTHKFPVPLAGGLLIEMTILIIFLIFHDWWHYDIIVMLIGAFVIFLFGIWDDRKGLSAFPKLLGQLIAGGFLIYHGVQVHFADILYHTGYITWFIAQSINITITFLWLIGITNAVNMIDSMDGIVAGIGIIASACYLYATIMSSQQILSICSGILLGVCVGLYFWNKVAGKLFLGDSGSQVIGFLLATLGILYNPRNMNPKSSWFLPIMLLGIPIFDTTLVVFSRLRRRQFVGVGRRDHTYHRLIAFGFSPNVAVAATHLATLIVSGLAFYTLFLKPIPALLVFFMTLILGLTTLFWFEKKPTLDNTI